MLINIERIHVWLSLLKIWVGCKPPTPFLITRNAGFGHRHWQVYNWLSSLSCMYDIIYTSGLPVLLVTEAQFLDRWATVLHYTFNEKKKPSAMLNLWIISWRTSDPYWYHSTKRIFGSWTKFNLPMSSVWTSAMTVSYTHLTLPTICSV